MQVITSFWCCHIVFVTMYGIVMTQIMPCSWKESYNKRFYKLKFFSHSLKYLFISSEITGLGCTLTHFLKSPYAKHSDYWQLNVCLPFIFDFCLSFFVIHHCCSTNKNKQNMIHDFIKLLEQVNICWLHLCTFIKMQPK